MHIDKFSTRSHPLIGIFQSFLITRVTIGHVITLLFMGPGCGRFRSKIKFRHLAFITAALIRVHCKAHNSLLVEQKLITHSEVKGKSVYKGIRLGKS